MAEKTLQPVLHCHEVTAGRIHEIVSRVPVARNIDVDYLFSLLPGQRRRPCPDEAEATAATVCFFLSYLAITVNGLS